MTPDELRALADALSSGTHYVESPELHETMMRAADYLRACADVQPVRAVPIGHALSAVRHVGSANYPDRERAAIERLYSAEFDAYAHPAPAASQADASRMSDALQSIRKHVADDPSALAAAIVATCDSVLDAAPQAEPIDPHMIVAEDRFPDVPAEPKREPLTALRILEIEDNASRQWRDNGRIIEYAVVFARMIERAHGIGGSDAE